MQELSVFLGLSLDRKTRKGRYQILGAPKLMHALLNIVQINEVVLKSMDGMSNSGGEDAAQRTPTPTMVVNDASSQNPPSIRSDPSLSAWKPPPP